MYTEISSLRAPRLLSSLLLFLLPVIALACSDDDDGNGDADSQATAAGGGEPEATASPAEATGGTGATGTTGATGGGSSGPVQLRDDNLRVEQISGLSQPTQIVFLGPDDLLVSEKTGNIVRVMDGEVQDEAVLELPANYADERGVLGLTLHPEFETNNWDEAASKSTRTRCAASWPSRPSSSTSPPPISSMQRG